MALPKDVHKLGKAGLAVYSPSGKINFFLPRMPFGVNRISFFQRHNDNYNSSFP